MYSTKIPHSSPKKKGRLDKFGQDVGHMGISLGYKAGRVGEGLYKHTGLKSIGRKLGITKSPMNSGILRKPNLHKPIFRSHKGEMARKELSRIYGTNKNLFRTDVGKVETTAKKDNYYQKQLEEKQGKLAQDDSQLQKEFNNENSITNRRDLRDKALANSIRGDRLRTQVKQAQRKADKYTRKSDRYISQIHKNLQKKLDKKDLNQSVRESFLQSEEGKRVFGSNNEERKPTLQNHINASSYLFKLKQEADIAKKKKEYEDLSISRARALSAINEAMKPLRKAESNIKILEQRIKNAKQFKPGEVEVLKTALLNIKSTIPNLKQNYEQVKKDYKSTLSKISRSDVKKALLAFSKAEKISSVNDLKQASTERAFSGKGVVKSKKSVLLPSLKMLQRNKNTLQRQIYSSKNLPDAAKSQLNYKLQQIEIEERKQKGLLVEKQKNKDRTKARQTQIVYANKALRESFPEGLKYYGNNGQEVRVNMDNTNINRLTIDNNGKVFYSHSNGFKYPLKLPAQYRNTIQKGIEAQKINRMIKTYDAKVKQSASSNEGYRSDNEGEREVFSSSVVKRPGSRGVSTVYSAVDSDMVSSEVGSGDGDVRDYNSVYEGSRSESDTRSVGTYNEEARRGDIEADRLKQSTLNRAARLKQDEATRLKQDEADRLKQEANIQSNENSTFINESRKKYSLNSNELTFLKNLSSAELRIVQKRLSDLPNNNNRRKFINGIRVFRMQKTLQPQTSPGVLQKINVVDDNENGKVVYTNPVTNVKYELDINAENAEKLKQSIETAEQELEIKIPERPEREQAETNSLNTSKKPLLVSNTNRPPTNITNANKLLQELFNQDLSGTSNNGRPNYLKDVTKRMNIKEIIFENGKFVYTNPVTNVKYELDINAENAEKLKQSIETAEQELEIKIPEISQSTVVSTTPFVTLQKTVPEVTQQTNKVPSPIKLNVENIDFGLYINKDKDIDPGTKQIKPEILEEKNGKAKILIIMEEVIDNTIQEFKKKVENLTEAGKEEEFRREIEIYKKEFDVDDSTFYETDSKEYFKNFLETLKSNPKQIKMMLQHMNNNTELFKDPKIAPIFETHMNNVNEIAKNRQSQPTNKPYSRHYSSIFSDIFHDLQKPSSIINVSNQTSYNTENRHAQIRKEIMNNLKNRYSVNNKSLIIPKLRNLPLVELMQYKKKFNSLDNSQRLDLLESIELKIRQSKPIVYEPTPTYVPSSNKTGDYEYAFPTDFKPQSQKTTKNPKIEKNILNANKSLKNIYPQGLSGINLEGRSIMLKKNRNDININNLTSVKGKIFYTDPQTNIKYELNDIPPLFKTTIVKGIRSQEIMRKETGVNNNNEKFNKMRPILKTPTSTLPLPTSQEIVNDIIKKIGLKSNDPFVTKLQNFDPVVLKDLQNQVSNLKSNNNKRKLLNRLKKNLRITLKASTGEQALASQTNEVLEKNKSKTKQEIVEQQNVVADSEYASLSNTIIGTEDMTTAGLTPAQVAASALPTLDGLYGDIGKYTPTARSLYDTTTLPKNNPGMWVNANNDVILYHDAEMTRKNLNKTLSQSPPPILQRRQPKDKISSVGQNQVSQNPILENSGYHEPQTASKSTTYGDTGSKIRTPPLYHTVDRKKLATPALDGLYGDGYGNITNNAIYEEINNDSTNYNYSTNYTDISPAGTAAPASLYGVAIKQPPLTIKNLKTRYSKVPEKFMENFINKLDNKSTDLADLKIEFIKLRKYFNPKDSNDAKKQMRSFLSTQGYEKNYSQIYNEAEAEYKKIKKNARKILKSKKKTPEGTKRIAMSNFLKYKINVNNNKSINNNNSIVAKLAPRTKNNKVTNINRQKTKEILNKTRKLSSSSVEESPYASMDPGEGQNSIQIENMIKRYKNSNKKNNNNSYIQTLKTTLIEKYKNELKKLNKNKNKELFNYIRAKLKTLIKEQFSKKVSEISTNNRNNFFKSKTGKKLKVTNNSDVDNTVNNLTLEDYETGIKKLNKLKQDRNAQEINLTKNPLYESTAKEKKTYNSTIHAQLNVNSSKPYYSTIPDLKEPTYAEVSSTREGKSGELESQYNSPHYEEPKNIRNRSIYEKPYNTEVIDTQEGIYGELPSPYNNIRIVNPVLFNKEKGVPDNLKTDNLEEIIKKNEEFKKSATNSTNSKVFNNNIQLIREKLIEKYKEKLKSLKNTQDENSRKTYTAIKKKLQKLLSNKTQYKTNNLKEELRVDLSKEEIEKLTPEEKKNKLEILNYIIKKEYNEISNKLSPKQLKKKIEEIVDKYSQIHDLLINNNDQSTNTLFPLYKNTVAPVAAQAPAPVAPVAAPVAAPAPVPVSVPVVVNPSQPILQKEEKGVAQLTPKNKTSFLSFSKNNKKTEKNSTPASNNLQKIDPLLNQSQIKKSLLFKNKKRNEIIKNIKELLNEKVESQNVSKRLVSKTILSIEEKQALEKSFKEYPEILKILNYLPVLETSTNSNNKNRLRGLLKILRDPKLKPQSSKNITVPAPVPAAVQKPVPASVVPVAAEVPVAAVKAKVPGVVKPQSNQTSLISKAQEIAQETYNKYKTELEIKSYNKYTLLKRTAAQNIKKELTNQNRKNKHNKLTVEELNQKIEESIKAEHQKLDKKQENEEKETLEKKFIEIKQKLLKKIENLSGKKSPELYNPESAVSLSSKVTELLKAERGNKEQLGQAQAEAQKSLEPHSNIQARLAQQTPAQKKENAEADAELEALQQQTN